MRAKSSRLFDAGRGVAFTNGLALSSWVLGGKPTLASPNNLARQFKVSEPNKLWETDMTYILTYEVWFYLAVALDLFSRQVIG